MLEKQVISSVVDQWKFDPTIAHSLAYQIFKEGGELARKKLRAYGFRGSFATPFYYILAYKDKYNNNFVFLDDVAKFYGVEFSYLENMLPRFGFGTRRTPDHVTTDMRRKMISSTLALALAPMMYYGRKIPQDSQGAKVYEFLCGSEYTAYAEARLSPRALLVENAPTPRNSQITLKEIGDMIQSAVVEAVSKAIAELQPPQPVVKVSEPVLTANKEPEVPVYQELSEELPSRRGKKIRKPANWDAVYPQYKSGSIPANAAAKMVGMAYSTFYRYAQDPSKFN